MHTAASQLFSHRQTRPRQLGFPFGESRTELSFQLSRSAHSSLNILCESVLGFAKTALPLFPARANPWTLVYVGQDVTQLPVSWWNSLTPFETCKGTWETQTTPLRHIALSLRVSVAPPVMLVEQSNDGKWRNTLTCTGWWAEAHLLDIMLSEMHNSLPWVGISYQRSVTNVRHNMWTGRVNRLSLRWPPNVSCTVAAHAKANYTIKTHWLTPELLNPSKINYTKKFGSNGYLSKRTTASLAKRDLSLTARFLILVRANQQATRLTLAVIYPSWAASAANRGAARLLTGVLLNISCWRSVLWWLSPTRPTVPSFSTSSRDFWQPFRTISPPARSALPSSSQGASWRLEAWTVVWTFQAGIYATGLIWFWLRAELLVVPL